MCIKAAWYALVRTEAGTAVSVCTDSGVAAIVWPVRSVRAARRSARRLAGTDAKQVSPGRLPGGLARRLRDYFAGRAVDFADVPVDLSGQPAFRARVLAALRAVGYGRTITYAGLARRVGRPGAARAVGQAMAANPLPIVIPCHRVRRSDGGLGGFSAPGGAGLKRRLLEMERRTR